MNRNRFVSLSGLIAAQYVVLTMLSSVFGLASGAVQLRLSEALTILPCFTAAAVPGLFVGCIIANVISGCAWWDVVFGSLATLIGAVGTRCRTQNNSRQCGDPNTLLSHTKTLPFLWIGLAVMLAGIQLQACCAALTKFQSSQAWLLAVFFRENKLIYCVK